MPASFLVMCRTGLDMNPATYATSFSFVIFFAMAFKMSILILVAFVTEFVMKMSSQIPSNVFDLSFSAKAFRMSAAFLTVSIFTSTIGRGEPSVEFLPIVTH